MNKLDIINHFPGTLGTLEHAFAIASIFHVDIKDKGGQAYFKHPLWISSELLKQGASDSEIIVGIMHDIVEDTEVTIQMLHMFSNEVTDALIAISRIDNEDRKVYIRRVAQNVIAKKVKLLDLRHNMDLTRLKNRHCLEEKDLCRIKLYAEEFDFLSGGKVGY